MFGSNELANRMPLEAYRGWLQRLVATLVNAGVIPVLSTIPHRTDNAIAAGRVAAYNGVIVTVAAEAGVPLWNYWRTLQGPEMVAAGMAPDGIHPNAMGFGGVLTPSGLRYGFNQRNLTALQVLARLKQVVYEDGPPD